MEKLQNGVTPNGSFDESTRDFYDKNAESYALQTAQADLSQLYARFLPLIPRAGRILDVGCGGGRELRHFKRLGYDCIGIDPASHLVRIARTYADCEVLVGTAQEIAFTSEFDGVWACASLLHLGRRELALAIDRIQAALRPNGALFLSIQEGAGEFVSDDGRFYARYLSQELVEIINASGLTTLDVWSTQDTLPGRESMLWLNLLARKVSA